MNILPRVFESIPIYLGKQDRWISVPLGHNYLMDTSIGVIAWIYFTFPYAIKPTFRKIIEIVIGSSDAPTLNIPDTDKHAR